MLKDINLADIRFHDLNFFYCTLFLKNNISEKAVSKQLGHATEIINVDVYEKNEEILTDCLEELEPFIESIRPRLKGIVYSDFSNDDKLLKQQELLVSDLLLV